MHFGAENNASPTGAKTAADSRPGLQYMDVIMFAKLATISAPYTHRKALC